MSRVDWRCRLGRHSWGIDSGICRDGWVWVTPRCVRCGAFHNPFMEAGVKQHEARQNRGEYAYDESGNIRPEVS